MKKVLLFFFLGLGVLGLIFDDEGETESVDTTPDCMTDSECWAMQSGHAGGILFWARDLPGKTQFLEAMPTECRDGFVTEGLLDARAPYMATIGELLRYVPASGSRRTDTLREHFPGAMKFTNTMCNGHNDWYLPSMFELLQMIRQPEMYDSPFRKDAIQNRVHTVGPYLTTDFGSPDHGNRFGPCLLQYETTGLYSNTNCWGEPSNYGISLGQYILIRDFTVPTE